MPHEILVCVECLEKFLYPEEQRAMFRKMNFEDPRRCMTCREARRERDQTLRRKQGKAAPLWEVTCVECGVKDTVIFDPTARPGPYYCRIHLPSRRVGVGA